MFQFHFLIKELTALENVRLPLLKKGTGRLEADERSLQLLNELGLKDKSNRPAYKLSGGEQQRVAIARSLANSPRYLLADEPTGNLDSKNSESVFELLLEMAEKLKLAVILVTHNEKLADLSAQNFEWRTERSLFDFYLLNFFKSKVELDYLFFCEYHKFGWQLFTFKLVGMESTDFGSV